MNWIILNSQEQLNQIKSSECYHAIFKHSTRCPVSMMAKRRFEMGRDEIPQDLPVYYLDLLAYREISNAIAEQFSVHHESPQLLLIKDGECIYEASHSDITTEELAEQIAQS